MKMNSWDYRYPRVVCASGFSMSVQAHDGAYCKPRANNAARYIEVEVDSETCALESLCQKNAFVSIGCSVFSVLELWSYNQTLLDQDTDVLATINDNYNKEDILNEINF